MRHIEQTNLQIQLDQLLRISNSLKSYKVNTLGIELLSILLGFFTSTALSTIPAQAGDWGIIAAAIIIGNQEIISRISYQDRMLSVRRTSMIIKTFLKYCNSIKIGILYGLFVDAFKLGS